MRAVHGVEDIVDGSPASPIRTALCGVMAVMVPARTLIGSLENRSWRSPSYVLPLMGACFVSGVVCGFGDLRRERKRLSRE
jgi:hypothetical protein